jgi:hypothetical protein
MPATKTGAIGAVGRVEDEEVPTELRDVVVAAFRNRR